MKKIVLFIAFLFVSYMSFGQMGWEIDFENPFYFDKIFVDTVTNPSNIWQIGQPNKTLFDSAHSPTHVIITDSVNPYPINDTSSFIITHLRPYVPWGGNIILLLDFYFKMDSDTLTEYGMIELSVDQGQTWFDIMILDTLLQFSWFEPKPSLTGSTPEWTHFSVNICEITWYLGMSDTILYKFTFISDSLQTNKEGWMIDDFQFADLYMEIEEHRDDNLISIFPNPTSDYITIERKNQGKNETVEVMDLSGRTILINRHFKGEMVDLRSLKIGYYLLKYTNTENVAFKRFMVTK